MKRKFVSYRRAYWIFREYKTEQDYPENVWTTSIWNDHTAMKEFSAERSHLIKGRGVYPDYCSMYWKKTGIKIVRLNVS